METDIATRIAELIMSLLATAGEMSISGETLTLSVNPHTKAIEATCGGVSHLMVLRVEPVNQPGWKRYVIESRWLWSVGGTPWCLGEGLEKPPGYFPAAGDECRPVWVVVDTLAEPPCVVTPSGQAQPDPQESVNWHDTEALAAVAAWALNEWDIRQ